MAMICKNSVSECTGCMMCQDGQDSVFQCDSCGDSIFDGEKYVEIFVGRRGFIICEACIAEGSGIAGE